MHFSLPCFDADQYLTCRHVYVSDIIQKVSISVHENGTKAVGFSMVNIKLASGGMPPAIDTNRTAFLADHPFFFAVRDNINGVLLFVGMVSDFKDGSSDLSVSVRDGNCASLTGDTSHISSRAAAQLSSSRCGVLIVGNVFVICLLDYVLSPRRHCPI